MLKLKVKKEVKEALDENRAVLALESTIISHGMPYPQNIEMALKLEAITRENGAVPATIAVIDGEVCIGLNEDQIQALGKAQGVRKLSRADLADCVAKKEMGATTVAATMIIAKLGGIEVFATGGIGGVHRGAETSFDISADLQELAQTRMIVVCAGAKAILDLPKTYEVLESLGVPVYAFGADEIPAFYSRSSGIKAPLTVQETAEIALAFRLQSDLNLPAALLVNNPIPPEREIPATEILPIIDQALDEASKAQIKAKDVTPYLLDKIYHLTNGRSLDANISLVESNVALGARIALELAE